MSEKDVEREIKSAVESLTPDVKGKILSQCNSNTRKVMKMEKKNNSKILKSVISIAAALVLVMIGAFGYAIFTGGSGPDKSSSDRVVADTYYARVTFDVNPSIQFEIGSDNNVVAVAPMNDDGHKVMDGMNLAGTEIKVAVNAVIGSMVRHGYIDELANSILISVKTGEADQAEGERLQAEISGLVKQALQSDKVDGAVLSQSIKDDDEIVRLSEDYMISEGKVQLIKKIIAADNRYSFSQLAGLSINELNLLSLSGEKISDNIGASGVASDKKYIARDEAKAAALKHAGVEESKISRYSCEIDYELGRMVYEIEFNVGNIQYEYDVDAVNGSVVQSKREIDGADNDDRVPEGNYISRNEAKEAAFKHAKVTEAQVRELEIELEKENGAVVYQVEFKAAGFEYEYDIDALNGTVKKSEKERDD